MDKANVIIHIVDDRSESTSFNPKIHGVNFSDHDHIRVNRTLDGYTVIYKASEFLDVDNAGFMSALIKLLTKNLPNTLFEISLIYHTESDIVDDYFIKVRNAAILLMKISETGSLKNVLFGTTNVPTSPLQHYSEDMDDDEEEDEDDNDDEIIDPLGFLTKSKKSKKKKSKEYYGRSRVWKDAKNPKRDINRHGVVISSDKDDIRRDEKIIREFLRDFLPGDAGWKKEFRKELAKRWMNVYTISKKHLKTLEKNHRNSNRNKRINKGINTGLNFMNQMINRPIDRWSDPTK